MNKQPRLSAIIPSYNHAAYIGEAIEGILGQTLRDFELIIVDDGSTDNSWEIINYYAKLDSRIVAIRQENQGPSGAVNRALSQAKGNFIAAHTSDDRSVSNRFEEQATFLEGHSDYDAVGSFIEEIDAKGQTNTMGHYAAWFNVTIDINDPKSWVWKNKLAAPTVMLRRGFFERYGRYNPELIYTQDWEMWIRALSMGAKFEILREKLLQYRGHDDNLTHKNHTQIFWEYAYISSKTLHPWLMAIRNESLVVNNIAGFWRHELFPRLNQNERVALVNALLSNLKGTFREFFLTRNDEQGNNRIATAVIETYCQDREQLVSLIQTVAERNQTVAERDQQINRLNQTVAERDQQINSLNEALTAIQSSLSWQITSPLRNGRTWLRRWCGC
jgi:glycosyltransferase involved in cell wall biosynthesis